MTRIYQPHDYQKKIISHILDVPRCAVWAGMGTGKTSSTLTAIDALQLAGDGSPVLVLAPLRVCTSTWPEEVSKWAHLSDLRVVPVTGSEKERQAALRNEAPIYATNYENLPWLVDHFGAHWPFKTIIADESTRLKSFRLRQGGVRAQALAKVAHTKVKRFINLTGTPAPNGLLDLWGQTWMLDRGDRLGRTYSAFVQRWFTQGYDGYSYEILGEYAADEIHDKLRDICLTIDPKDYFDLAEPIVKNVYINLPAASRRHYDKLERELETQIEQHTITAANAAVKTQKLLQVANGAAYVDPSVDDDVNPKSKKYTVLHDAKLDALESIVNEAAGSPVLVAFNFRSDCERILKGFKKAELLGKSPETLERWNKGKIPMLLAHPKSAGHGLNMQHGGNILVFFGHNWSLEDRLQIIERIGPMRQKQAGYDRPVWIYNIVARDTVDEMVMERVETKRSIQDVLLKNMKRT